MASVPLASAVGAITSGLNWLLQAKTVQVKACLSSLNDANSSDDEVRVFSIPMMQTSCCSGIMNEFIKDIGSSFDSEVADEVIYFDTEDSITVSTDNELLAVLKHHFRNSTTMPKFVATRLVVPCSNRVASTATPWTSLLSFWVNGDEIAIENPDPATTLLDWLREEQGILGIHVGCGEGGCGICSVALVHPGESVPVPINSCLRKLVAVDGCHVITSEGIGSVTSKLHPVQQAIADGNGSQCGFCTPGWVMQMYTLLAKTPSPGPREVETHFDGNLCRCTGYRPILEAFRKMVAHKHHQSSTSAEYKTTLISTQPTIRPLHFSGSSCGVEYYRPATLDQCVEVYAIGKESGKQVQPICASTGDGVTKYLIQSKVATTNTIFVDVSCLPELLAIGTGTDGINVGAAVPIADVINELQSSHEIPAYSEIASHLLRVASVQIRSVASWAGNLMLTKKCPQFASDIATVLAGVGAKVRIVDPFTSESSTVTIPELLEIDFEFLIISMVIPLLSKECVFRSHKTAQRSVFSHAIVNFAGSLTITSAGNTKVISDSNLVFGGVATKLLVASQVASTINGKALNESTLSAAFTALANEISVTPSTDPRHSQEFRVSLAQSFLYKIFLSALYYGGQLPPRLAPAVVPFIPAQFRPISSGSESFGVDPLDGPIGRYYPKLDSRIQASGEARYPSDAGAGRNALWGQLVLSQEGNNVLTHLDTSNAMSMSGVVAFISADDIPLGGKNQVNGHLAYAGSEASRMGLNSCEKIFYSVGDLVPHVGAPLGLIVADTWKNARHAARQVKQAFVTTKPIIHDVYNTPKRISTSDVEASGKSHVILQRGLRPDLAAGISYSSPRTRERSASASASGTFRTGGQRHFYMETQSVCASTTDDGEWEVISSDQWGATTHLSLAIALGIPYNKINVICSRAGGGFGGKLTRQLIASCAAVLAVNKLRRPVQIQFERSDDLQLCAGREPMNFDYTVKYDPATGKVQDLDMTMTIDPGWYLGDSVGSLAFAVNLLDNCYQYENFNVQSAAQLTNTPKGTAMRAPGAMQSIVASEVVIEHVAKLVNRPTSDIQELNFYDLSSNPVTPIGDHLGKDGFNWTIPELWTTIKTQSDYENRISSIKTFNSNSRYVKKGLAISPTKYPMNTVVYHTGVLVNIYPDGTVFVSTGCSEIGQGLNTKVILCVAEALGCPVDVIKIGPRETRIIPNNSGTGGSGTSETAARAATLACAELVTRLQPYMKSGKSFQAAVADAIQDKVCLFATGFSMRDPTPNHDVYATYGVAVSEVMVDILTGEVRVERVDVLMDLGNQLDAAVDIGQIQGGFVMSMGYILTEELKVDASGTQLNLGTWEYKIPTAYDIPIEFNVALLQNSPNPVGFKSSKACAEPAMTLVSSIYLAVKEAIYAAREEMGNGSDWFMLNLPLTCENVRSAIGTQDFQLQ